MKEYTISFGDWIIEAENDKEAEAKALEMLDEGEKPQLNFIEEN